MALAYFKLAIIAAGIGTADACQAEGRTPRLSRCRDVVAPLIARGLAGYQEGG